MTIIADSLYVGNDMGKLARNSYRKHDPDFSGMVLYFTPKGAYLEGYAYQNGHLVAPAQPGQEQNGSQKVTNGLKIDKMVEECTDYYIVYYTNGVYTSDEYLTTICDQVDDGLPDPPSGGGSPPPPPPCHKDPPPAVESVNGGRLVVNFIPPPDDPGDGGMPPPKNDPCTPEVKQNSNLATAFDDKIKDSLKHDCLIKLFNAIKNLKSGNIATIISNLSGAIPSYNWTISEGTLAAKVNGLTTYKAGVASTKIDYDKLKGATDIAVIRTMIHEAIHAYLSTYFYNDLANFSKTYPQQLEYFLQSKSPDLNDAQHVVMAKAFIADIASASKAVAKSLGYNNIDDLTFEDLAWGGLTDTKAFQSLSADDQKRINDRVTAEQTNIVTNEAYPEGTKLTCH